MQNDPVVIVSGLPRSGTSLVMQMLQAGGVPLVTDGTRAADISNSRGYFELEAVKNIETDTTFLAAAPGKAIKIISFLLPYLAAAYRYRIIFVRRNLEEILDSQRRMRTAAGLPYEPDHALRSAWHNHLNQIENWLHLQENTETMFINHAQLLQSPQATAVDISRFVQRELNIAAMAGTVDPGLYRSRKI